MANLEIGIGGDITDLNKKIKEAEVNLKELSKIKLEKIKLGLDTKEIDGNIKSVKQSIAGYKTSIKDLGGSFAGMAPKIANGGNALTQFSRIAQDAPFGIMGIGNNITATAEAFGHLQKETGSTGAALKAVASSMMGTGGILLAVSLVTTGLTYMAQNGLTVSDVFKKLTGDFDGTAKAMNDLNVEAAKNAQSEISKMNAYVSVAKDVNLSMEDRLIAVRKLQDEYPAYFGNLTKEQILNGNVAGAVKEVTKALISKAKAAAAVGKIVDLAEKEEIIQEKINKAVAEMAKFYHLSGQAAKDFAAVMQKQLTGQIDLIKVLNEGNAQSLSTSEKQALAAIQYSKTLQGLGSELRENTALQDKYTQKINEETAAQIKLETAVNKVKKAKAGGTTPQVAGVKSTLIPAPLIDANSIKVFNGQIDQYGNKIKELPGIIKTGTIDANIALNQGFKGMSDTMVQFNQSANALIQGLFVDTFMSLGEMIGNSLTGAEGGLEDAGKVILGVLGNFMTKYGELMITTGTALIIGETMIESGNGYAMVAGGIVLVAAGTAFANQSKSARSNGGRGSGGGSVSTGASYSSPVSSGGGTSFGGGNVVFEIAGTSLIGVLNNTLDKNKRLGGNLPIG